ncbi:MAG: sterol desaturase [Myxococcales bacterium]|nr:sterol desaturase [Myxococcales bacterium]
MDLALVPFFGLGVMTVAFSAELLVSWRFRRDQRYGLHDTIANIATGGIYVLTSLVKGLLIGGILWGAYQVSPWRWDLSSPWSWLVLLLVYEFFFYWSHWASHRFQFMWAFHAVHHNSTKFNISTGMRNSWFGGYIDWVFLLPCVLLGFDPLAIGAIQAFCQLWDYLCHTQYVGKLGPLEWITNTPSNHRVHHSSDLTLGKSNLGSMLIIFDRLFGTYRKEPATIVYGATPMPTKPFNLLHLQFYLFRKNAISPAAMPAAVMSAPAVETQVAI